MPSTGLDASVTPDASTGLDASTTQSVSNEGLDVVTASNVGDGDLSVGPAGGHLVFANGVILDVPAGALSKTITISASVVPASTFAASSPPSAIVAALNMQPDGLTFSLPATLTIPIPSTFNGSPVDGTKLLVASTPSPSGDEVPDAGASRGDASDDPVTDEEDPEAEPLASTYLGDGTLHVQVFHFTNVVVFYGPYSPTFTLDDAKALTSSRTFATILTLGVSRQIFTVMQQLASPPLQQITPTGALYVTDPLGGWLWPDAATALEAAGNSFAPPSRVGVSYTWRSLATQYVLQKPGVSLMTADVGQSTHGMGIGIDLATPYNTTDACNQELVLLNSPTGSASVANAFFPGNVVATLSTNDFNWWQVTHPLALCSDPVHFTYQGATSLQTPSISAFQILWNYNNPCNLITEGSIVGVQTLAALAETPAGGFPNIPSSPTAQPDLPAKGVLGDGCPLKNGDQSEVTCCPGMSPGIGPAPAPSCQVTCCNATTCPDGCCDSQGMCQSGTDDRACGSGGQTCVTCMGSDTCGGGGAPQTCGVSNDGGPDAGCDSNSCPNGCCDSQGMCQSGTDDTACGSGGQGCVACMGSDTCMDEGMGGMCGPSDGGSDGSDGGDACVVRVGMSPGCGMAPPMPATLALMGITLPLNYNPTTAYSLVVAGTPSSSAILATSCSSVPYAEANLCVDLGHVIGCSSPCDSQGDQ